MKRTKEEAEVTRQKLLQAALVLFGRRGYDATRLEDIAEEAGVTRGAIYHHFGSKVELYNTLVTEAWGRVLVLITEAIDEGGTAIDILRRTSVRKLAYVEEDATFRAINEIILFKTAMTPDLASAMDAKREGMRGGIEGIAAQIEAGIADGSIRRDVNVMDAALAFHSLQNGIMLLWLLDPRLFSIKARAEAMVNQFLDGIAAR